MKICDLVSRDTVWSWRLVDYFLDVQASCVTVCMLLEPFLHESCAARSPPHRHSLM